jgi:hypothetical protein
VASVLELNSLQVVFHLPLSEEAYAQFCELDILMQSVQLTSDKDTWNYIWGSTQYSSKKAYDHLLGSQQVHPAFGWIWKSSCQMNVTPRAMESLIKSLKLQLSLKERANQFVKI